MPLLTPNNGEGDGLAYFVNKAAPEDLVLRLFVDNVTPNEVYTAASVTQASGFGYAPITLSGASWTITEGAPTFAAYPQQTFTFTGALGPVYGYYLTRATSGRIAVIERFSDGPYTITNNGDQIKITPTLTMD